MSIKIKQHSRIGNSPILSTPAYTPQRTRSLTPELLSRQLDAFRSGRLRDAVLTWERMEDRDETVRIASSKRKKAVARHGYEVLTLNESAAAQEHRKTLEYFYEHLQVTHALDENERGGFQLLVRQMMDAIGKKYAVHEIVWKPGDNSTLSAELRFVPLWCFENTTGNLHFKPTEFGSETIPLEPGGWMISVGEGLMMACSIACLFKQLPLQDWLAYCQQHGTPAVVGTSSADRGTAEWSDMLEALQEFSQNTSVLISPSESIQVISRGNAGTLPFPALVEEMTRSIISLWRGGDLSTRSIHYGTGASMQQDEAILLEMDDSEWISETLHAYLDSWIIHYTFGQNVRPLARVHLRNIQKSNVDTDLKVDEFLLQHQAPLSLRQMLERYQRSLPANDEPLVPIPGSTNPQQSAQTQQPTNNNQPTKQ